MRVSPIDVVRVVGAHVREQAAIVPQKCVRGAAACVSYWGQLPGLCDCDGNLVYYLEGRTSPYVSGWFTVFGNDE